MFLADVRDLVAGLGITDHCYMGKLPQKPQKAIGCYTLNRGDYKTHHGIGCDKSYGVYPASFLVHWNKSPRDTEQAARELFDTLDAIENMEVNGMQVKWINMVTSFPQDVGTDDQGIYERVIEAEIYYERSE